MKKGDLVVRNSDSDYLFRLAAPATWENPGVVIRGTYEGSLSHIDPMTGKNIGMTEITSVVDIMISGKLIQKVPTKYLSRVIR